MTSARTPSRPFPSQAVFSLEARHTDEDGSPLLPATLVMPALEDLRRFTSVYFERFGTEQASIGQTVGLRGSHGAGKTHALGFLMRKLASGRIAREANANIETVLQLYAKAEEPGLVGVYRSLMSQVSATTLRELMLRFTADLAGDTIAATAPDPELVAQLRARLREEPRLVKEMLRAYFVDESEMLRMRDEEIARLTDGSTDFANAFSWLESELDEQAHRWFSGEALDPDDLSKLGVSGAIATAETARFGMQLLAALCSRSGIPLIVFVDQYEKLVLDASGELDRAAAGTIHTLAEVIPREDAMLVLSGNDQAWEQLPPDLQQRFGRRVVECRGLDLSEAKALVNLYLRPREEAFVDRELGEADLFPFTLGGLALLHLYSGGNPRRLLELCAAAYEVASPGEGIGREEACAAAERAGTERIDRPTVVAAVRQVAESRGYAVSLVEDGVGSSVQLSLSGRDRLRVLIGQAAHYYDEVLDAVEYLDLVEGLRRANTEVHLVLLVLGYESPEVRSTLERAGIDVLDYDPSGFAQEFGDVLDRIGGALAVEVSFEEDRYAAEFAEIRQTLDELAREREADVRGIAAKTAVIEEHHEQGRTAARWKQAIDDWVGERRKLEDAIREVRRERELSDLQEMERLRAQAEKDRTRRREIAFSALGILLVVAFALTFFALSLNRFASSFAWVRPLAWGTWLVFAAVLILGYTRLFTLGPWRFREHTLRTALQRELAAPVGSIDDLRRLANRTRLRSVDLDFYLRHPNPQVRYVAAVAAEESELEDLANTLPGERCALVRGAYAKRIATSDTGVAIEALSRLADSDTPEADYILEGLVHRDINFDGARSVPRWDRLWALMGAMCSALRFTPATRVLLAQPTLGREAAVHLDAAILAGLPFALREDLTSLSSELLRQAVRSVSPFDPAGLATVDQLSMIDDLDNAFLMLSQLLFMCELGLLVAYR